MPEANSSTKTKLDRHRLRNAVTTLRAGVAVLRRRGADPDIIEQMDAELRLLEEALGLT